MKKLGLLAMVLILLGCSSLSGKFGLAPEDMRLANLALDEIKEGHYKTAEDYCDRALAINPDNAYALLNLGVVYHHTGRPEQARTMYQKVIDLDAKDDYAQRCNIEKKVGKPLLTLANENLEMLP